MSTAAPPELWLPRLATPVDYDADTDGGEVVAWAHDLLHVHKSSLIARSGDPLTILPWQCWLLDALLERRADGRRKYRTALVGLARKNGKSLLGAVLALYHLLMGEPGTEVYGAAGDRKQAKIVFGEARWQVENSPLLADACEVYRDAIEVRSTGAVYRVLSADARLQQGLNPEFVIFDEVHVQRNSDLWDALTLGSGTRVDPLVVGITTAGDDVDDSLLGDLYRHGAAVATGELHDPSFGFWWWEPSDPDCSVWDRDAWAEANPNLAHGVLDVEDMEASATRTGELAFRRYRLNQWVTTMASWLPDGRWEAQRHPGAATDPNGEPVVLGVDASLNFDSTAVVAVQRQDGQVVAQAEVIEPPGDGSIIDLVQLGDRLRWLIRRFPVRTVAYDRHFIEHLAQELADEFPEVTFRAVQQSRESMSRACATAYEVIESGQLVHDFGATATRQVVDAEAHAVGEGWRLRKPRGGKRHIDTAVALVMALDELAGGEEPTGPVFAW